jgi:hypothetical protein
VFIALAVQGATAASRALTDALDGVPSRSLTWPTRNVSAVCGPSHGTAGASVEMASVTLKG